MVEQQLDKGDIQGNVLAGFNKDHMSFVFFQVADQAHARAWLAAHLDEIATTDEVEAFNRAYKVIRRHRGPHIEEDLKPIAATWINIAFSSAGLTALVSGTPIDLSGLPPEFNANIHGRASELGHSGASDPSQWDAAFQVAGNVHGVLIIAADRKVDRDNSVSHYSGELAGNGFTVLTDATWEGNVRADEPGHEHFGFKDGISQPGVIGYSKNPDANGVPASAFLLGLEDAPAAAEPAPVAVPQPYGGTTPPTPPTPPAPIPAWMKNGSYLVLQKLEQNVPGFNAGVQQLAGSLSVTPETAGAKLVGRHKSGCPVAHINGFSDVDTTVDPTTATPPTKLEILDDAHVNDFVYSDDVDGARTPRAAHIRKTWPRDQTPPPLGEAAGSRILRRGIPYGASLQPPRGVAYGDVVAPDGGERGLLFGCYQSSIANQFERIQATWAAASGFPVNGDGVDAILNQVQGQTITVPPGAAQGIQPWVRMRGGGYFFSPGIAGLRALVTTPA